MGDPGRVAAGIWITTGSSGSATDLESSSPSSSWRSSPCTARRYVPMKYLRSPALLGLRSIRCSRRSNSFTNYGVANAVKSRQPQHHRQLGVRGRGSERYRLSIAVPEVPTRHRRPGLLLTDSRVVRAGTIEASRRFPGQHRETTPARSSPPPDTRPHARQVKPQRRGSTVRRPDRGRPGGIRASASPRPSRRPPSSTTKGRHPHRHPPQIMSRERPLGAAGQPGGGLRDRMAGERPAEASDDLPPGHPHRFPRSSSGTSSSPPVSPRPSFSVCSSPPPQRPRIKEGSIVPSLVLPYAIPGFVTSCCGRRCSAGLRTVNDLTGLSSTGSVTLGNQGGHPHHEPVSGSPTCSHHSAPFSPSRATSRKPPGSAGRTPSNARRITTRSPRRGGPAAHRDFAFNNFGIVSSPSKAVQAEDSIGSTDLLIT